MVTMSVTEMVVPPAVKMSLGSLDVDAAEGVRGVMEEM